MREKLALAGNGASMLSTMVTSTEQRRGARVSLRSLAQLHVHGLGQGISVQVRNLSKTGMAVEARRLPEVGARIDCHVKLTSRAWVVRGKIAWMRPDADPMPVAGIEFLDLSRADEAVLAQAMREQLGAAPKRALAEPDTERIRAGVIGALGGRLHWAVGVGVVVVSTAAILTLQAARSKARHTGAPGRLSLPDTAPAATLAGGPRLRPLPGPVYLHEQISPRSSAALTLALGARRSTVRIALFGSTDGAHSYRLANPPGTAVKLPHASVLPADRGRFAIERAGIGRVWIEQRAGGLHLRVLPQRGWSLLPPVIERDGVRVTAVR